MALRTFRLTDTQTTELRQAYERTKDGPTRTRFQAVRLYASGYPVEQIQEITGCSRTSLMDWCRLYRTHGVDALRDHRLGGNRAKLTPLQRQQLRARLHQSTPRQLFGPDAATTSAQFWTIPDLQRAVQLWFDVNWKSPTSYATLLDECGFSYQRTQKVYRSRREAEVMAFEEQLEKNSSTLPRMHRRQ